MADYKAPRQWQLTTTETRQSVESWWGNLMYRLSMDENFVPFLDPACKWEKQSATNPLRGLTDDVAAGVTIKSAAAKVLHLNLMLHQIANFASILARGTFVSKSTSVAAIKEAIKTRGSNMGSKLLVRSS